MNLVGALQKHKKVSVHVPRKGIYFTVSKERFSYNISGYIEDRPIDTCIISDIEMEEFARNLSI